MTRTEHSKCKYCGHTAHCGHSCMDETCDHCTECACADCQALDFDATKQDIAERGYN